VRASAWGLLRFVPLVALFASNCMLLNGRCIYELRGLHATGSVEENSIEILSGEITLSEQRDSDPNKSLYWRLSGSSLKGHVQSATLRSASPARVLYELPLSPPSQPTLAEGEVSDRDGVTSLNGWYEALNANLGSIEVRTDLPDRPSIALPLRVIDAQNWTRPYCS
jgi:hypothetical protein